VAPFPFSCHSDHCSPSSITPAQAGQEVIAFTGKWVIGLVWNPQKRSQNVEEKEHQQLRVGQIKLSNAQVSHRERFRESE
jgi:hypothetical protein